jgi:hypothetical protein
MSLGESQGVLNGASSPRRLAAWRRATARFVLVIILAMAGLLGLQWCQLWLRSSANPNRWHSPRYGFAITKPKGWLWASREDLARHRSQFRLENVGVERELKQTTPDPEVSILKYPPSHIGMNPNAALHVRRIEGLERLTALDMMRSVGTSYAREMKRLSFVEEPRTAHVGEFPAAYMKAAYLAISPNGAEFPALTRMWILRRGQLWYTIAMTGASEGEDQCEGEFATVLASIAFDP